MKNGSDFNLRSAVFGSVVACDPDVSVTADRLPHRCRENCSSAEPPFRIPILPACNDQRLLGAPLRDTSVARDCKRYPISIPVLFLVGSREPAQHDPAALCGTTQELSRNAHEKS